MRIELKLPFLDEPCESVLGGWLSFSGSPLSLSRLIKLSSPVSGMRARPADKIEAGADGISSLSHSSMKTGFTSFKLAALDTVNWTKSFSSRFSISSILSPFSLVVSSMQVPESPVSQRSNLLELLLVRSLAASSDDSLTGSGSGHLRIGLLFSFCASNI